MIHRVAIYARVSTQRQADHGYSIEDQQRRLEAVAARKGWQVVASFVDAGRSGRSVAGREQFQAMLAAADRHEFDALLVQHRDRFARNYIEAGIAHERLGRLGIAVLDEMNVDQSDRALSRNPEARLMRGTQDVYADYFSEVLATKTSNGIRRKVMMGLHWGDVPFGYRRPDKAEPMVIEAREAELVRDLFDRYVGGRDSMADLARWVNVQGFRTRNKRTGGSGPFTNSTVRVILDNPVYVGDLVLDGERLPGRHPALVDRSVFDEAARTRAVDRGRRPAKVEGRVYLVGGIARHSECHEPLWGASIAHTGFVYRCSARQRGAVDRCERMTRSAQEVDAEVSRLFSAIELPTSWRAEVAAMYEEQMSRRPAESVAEERHRLDARLRRVKQALVDDLMPYAEAAREIRSTEAALAALTPAFVSSRTVLAGDELTSMHELWPHMTPEERRESVRLVLESVEVDLRDASLTSIVPRPDFAPLFAAVAAAGGAVRNPDVQESVRLVDPRGLGSASHTQHIYVPSWRAA